MTDDQPRTDATSRERSPDHQYTLTIEQTAELYAAAGHPRTIRAIQKYCALSKLDSRKVETETGEKYLVAPYSVRCHIAYINEVRTDATRRDQSRTDANVRPLENKDEQPRTDPANSNEQPRTDATIRLDLNIFEHPYVKRLEAEVDEFKLKYEKQVRRTEDVLEDANRRLIEMAQAGQIAGSKTLAEYLLAAKGSVVSKQDGEALST
jgi:hypothetical protein